MTDNTVIVKPAADLGQLAVSINAEHLAASAALKTGVERARACGELLLAAKRLCGHGGWLPWLEKNCPGVGRRQAQRYMSLAKNWAKLSLANASPGTHLPIQAALAELTGVGDTDGQEPVDEYTQRLMEAASLLRLARGEFGGHAAGRAAADDPYTFKELQAIIDAARDAESFAHSVKIDNMTLLGEVLSRV